MPRFFRILALLAPALLAPALLALAGCDSPSPISDFAGVAPARAVVEGSTFSIRVAGKRAQAVRVNFQPGASAARVVPLAGLAMERISGCRVVSGSLRGDAAVAEARLACPATTTD